jgi:hypothetical protein
MTPAATLNGRHNAGYVDLFWHDDGWHTIQQVTVLEDGGVIRLHYGRPLRHVDYRPSAPVLAKLAHYPGPG